MISAVSSWYMARHILAFCNRPLDEIWTDIPMPRCHWKIREIDYGVFNIESTDGNASACVCQKARPPAISPPIGYSDANKLYSNS